MEITITSMDEQDTDRILKLLYHGEKPERVHTLICGCGAIADLRVSPKAWNGWQILPYARCPACAAVKPPADGDAYPALARARFFATIQAINSGGEEPCVPNESAELVEAR